MCDCKGFWQSLVCSHCVVLFHMLEKLDVPTEAEDLPKEKPKGRPKAATRALQRQPPDGDANFQ